MLKASNLSVSVVMTVFNEVHRLPTTLAQIRPYLDARFADYEVIVVDGNSSDGTPSAVEKTAEAWPNLRLLRQRRNYGKGSGIREGCLAAKHEIILFMDADLATPIEELDAILPKFEDGGYKAVVGVRTYQENESKWRRIVG